MEARLRTVKPGPVLRLHSNLPEVYRSKIDRLAEALNAPDTVTEAAEIMRGLIDRIVLTPVRGTSERNCMAISPCSHASPRRGNGDLVEIQRDYRWLWGIKGQVRAHSPLMGAACRSSSVAGMNNGK